MEEVELFKCGNLRTGLLDGGEGTGSPELGFGPLRRGASSLWLASLSGRCESGSGSIREVVQWNQRLLLEWLCWSAKSLMEKHRPEPGANRKEDLLSPHKSICVPPRVLIGSVSGTTAEMSTLSQCQQSSGWLEAEEQELNSQPVLLSTLSQVFLPRQEFSAHLLTSAANLNSSLQFK